MAMHLLIITFSLIKVSCYLLKWTFPLNIWIYYGNIFKLNLIFILFFSLPGRHGCSYSTEINQVQIMFYESIALNTVNLLYYDCTLAHLKLRSL